MKKLEEREPSSRAGLIASAPALAVQFFLIPLAVVAVLVSIYAGFRMLLADPRGPQDYLNEIRTGGRERRWPAAYELSRLMADPDVQRTNPGLGEALVRAFEESKDDDPRIRRYLALAIGRLQPPPPSAAAALLEATRDADSETVISAIWALGSMGDPSVVPELRPLYQSSDAGVRKMVVYAIGALPGDRGLSTLETALEDPAADVQWNAAVALARHGDASGLPVIRRMLDREYVEQAVAQSGSAPAGEDDPAGEVMISGLRAVAALKDPALRDPVTVLSREDRNLRVRQAALDALKEIGT